VQKEVKKKQKIYKFFKRKQKAKKNHFHKRHRSHKPENIVGLKSPKVKRMEVDLTPALEGNQAAALKMMNNYTRTIIPNILKDSPTTTKERRIEFHPPQRHEDSTLRDDFSSGEYSSNIQRIKANFKLKNVNTLRIPHIQNPRHNRSSFVSPKGDLVFKPNFDLLPERGIRSPGGNKDDMFSIISDNTLEKYQRKIAQDYKPNFSYNL